MYRLLALLSVIFLPVALSQTFAQLCAQGFGALQFSTANYARYEEYYSDTSVFVLAEAGEYTGPDDIAEYVQYADQNSPFIKEFAQPTRNLVLRSADETAGTCEFLSTTLTTLVMNEGYSVGANLTVATLSTFVYNLADNKIERLQIFYKPDFLQFWFGELLGGERTRSFICEVFDGCDSTKASNEIFLKDSSCMAELAKLPLLSYGGVVDGKDQGCRTLHSVFAQKNPHHCPHISFIPEEDDTGKSRCQVPKGIKPTDLFEDSDFAVFELFLTTAFGNDVDREQGYSVEYLETAAPTAAPTTTSSSARLYWTASMSMVASLVFWNCL